MHRILIPFRGPETGKSRLSATHTDDRRRELALSMFRHVLAVAAEVAGSETVVVVTPSADVARLAAAAGAEIVTDAGEGLNEAVALCCGVLTMRGVGQVTIIAADLPRLDEADVKMLIGAAANVVVCPDKAGTGTNALRVPLGRGFRFFFGPSSRAAHEKEAERCGLSVAALDRVGLAADLDTAADLEALSARL